MSEREAYISMPRHNGERFAKLMVRQFEQMNATLDNVGKSRWHELFGTPERAARTLVENHERQATCLYCIMADRPGNPCGDGDYDALLEWLRGDA